MKLQYKEVLPNLNPFGAVTNKVLQSAVYFFDSTFREHIFVKDDKRTMFRIFKYASLVDG